MTFKKLGNCLYFTLLRYCEKIWKKGVDRLFQQLKIGFLFDIDGTLTTYQRNDSVIDLLLMNDLENIRKRGMPIGLVTGRSVDWVNNHFFEYIDDNLREHSFISGEFGLVSFYDSKKTYRRLPKEIQKLLIELKKELTDIICDYRQLDVIESFEVPDERLLWIEPKERMITFRTLPSFGLTTEKYLRNIEPVMKDHLNILKIVPNKYAVDILPILATKKLAAEITIKALDPNKEINKWFAFGDTEADEEMGRLRKVQFIKVEQGMTRDTHYLIEKAMYGKL
ncbi:MAG: HAD-IIB family hydrolase [Asgard group archaeon]|nr:HAD-IIB family hydrolase [Asgard group archaeon]